DPQKLEQLSTLVKLNVQELSNIIDISPSTEVILRSGLSFSEVLGLGDLEGSGVELISGVRRNYLFGGYYAHVIGYTGQADLQDVEDGYSAGDQLGKSALESVFEDEL